METIKRIVAGLAIVGALLQVNGTFAQWSTGGEGEAFTAAATVSPLTTESAVAKGTLFPGGTGDVVLKVRNPNAFPVTLVGVDGNGPVTSSAAGCAHVTFTSQNGSWSLGAARSTTLTLRGAAAMAADAPAACQGATFTIPVRLRTAGGAPATTTTSTTSTTSTTVAGGSSAVTASPTSLDLGAARPGAAEPVRFVAFRNDGTAPTAVPVVTVAAPFHLGQSDCTAPVAPSGSCTVAVRFAPQREGTATGALRFVAGDVTVDVPLRGEGIEPHLFANPSTLDFGTKAAADPAIPRRTTTVANTGGADTFALQHVVSGPDASDFLVVQQCPSVAAGGSCEVVIEFRPRGTGQRSATLTLAERNAGAANASVSVTLTGTST